LHELIVVEQFKNVNDVRKIKMIKESQIEQSLRLN